MVPLDWYPRLAHASQAEQQNWILVGDGYRSIGPSWTRISALKACSPETAAAKATSHFNGGCTLATKRRVSHRDG